MAKEWKIFTGARAPHDDIRDPKKFPPPPPWRDFDGEVVAARPVGVQTAAPDASSFANRTRGQTFQVKADVVEMVNAALYLRRPLLVTGKPGTGKSSLIHAVAHELTLGDALEWPINSRSTLQQGLYEYDAVGRLREAQLGREDKIENYLRLGPLGSAFVASDAPRALLIDEIDKSDLDLPNDLLNIFEQGEFIIPELKRLGGAHWIEDHTGRFAHQITGGRVRCRAFPFVVMTSNGEREFPLPFQRRCLSLKMADPDETMLGDIVRAHLKEEKLTDEATACIREFDDRVRNKREHLTTDQLMNAVFLLKGLGEADAEERRKLVDKILKSLDA